MRIILDTAPHEDEFLTDIEINADAFDVFLIQKRGIHFQLALRKYYDAYFTNKSSIVYVLVTVDTYEKCIAVYQAIREARREGEVEFDLEAYLKKNSTTEGALRQNDLPTV